MAALLSVVTLTPFSAKLSMTCWFGSATVILSFWNSAHFSSPSTVAPPIAPAPMIAIFIVFSYGLYGMCWGKC